MVEQPDPQTRSNIRLAQSVRGRPPEQVFVPYTSMRHLLEMRAQESPEQVFLIYYDESGHREQWTYGELNARVNQVANFLSRDLGVRRGDRVATIAYNHSDTVLIYLACWKLGAAVAPQNVAEDDQRIAYILRNSEAVVALAREEYLARAWRIIHGRGDGLGAENIRQIVQVGGEPREDYPHFHEAVGRQPTTLGLEPPGLFDESLLVYTSGTTGPPKGVVLTQYNMLIDARSIADWQAITGNQRMMCVLPIHHVNGIIVTLVTPLYVGGSVVLNRAYSPAGFWTRMARERVHVVSVVPTLLQFSLEWAERRAAEGRSIWGDGISREDLAHFRHLICGAGTLSVALARRFEERFGFPVLHGYGLSETTCYSCFLPIDLSWAEHRHWMQDYGYPSIGCPIHCNEMDIFDPDGSGRALGPGERGEIGIRGHNVMKYYFQRPEANREAFKFGWFRSGDEGFYHEDGRGRRFFFITGRIKELINRGGVKFSPFDIEEVLLAYPGVKAAVAVAFENDYYGEEVGAYVVPQEGAALDPDAIIAYCRERMTFEKSPKVVVLGTEIPVTSTGKYQRLKLREAFSAWKSMQFREAE